MPWNQPYVLRAGSLDFARNDELRRTKLPLLLKTRIIFPGMDYDVAIIGGAFSGSATALVLKRRCPNARVLIMEKTSEFDRNPGEAGSGSGRTPAWGH